MHDLRSVLSERIESNQRSIYTCLVPLPSYDKSGDMTYMTEPPNPIDCTGRLSGNVPHLTSIDNDNDTRGRLHYATADFYSNLYQWNNSEVANSSADGYAYESVNRFNTVCFQGHQSMYNTTTKAYDITVSLCAAQVPSCLTCSSPRFRTQATGATVFVRLLRFRFPSVQLLTLLSDPGCGRVRRGMLKALDPVSFSVRNYSLFVTCF